FAVAVMGLPAIAFGATIPALLGSEQNVARDAGRLLCVSSLANGTGFLLMAFVIAPLMDYGPIIVLLSAAAAVSLLIAARPWALWRQGAALRSWRGRVADPAAGGGLVVLAVLTSRVVWDE